MYDVIPADRMAQRVNRVVALIAAQHSIAWPIDAKDSLVDGGFTSIAMVELMLAIEREFHLVIPDADLNPTNFGNVEALNALVGRLSTAERISGEPV